MYHAASGGHRPYAMRILCAMPGQGQGARGKGQCNAPYAIYCIGILLGIRDLT
jgi:hypothetical protein